MLKSLVIYAHGLTCAGNGLDLVRWEGYFIALFMFVMRLGIAGIRLLDINKEPSSDQGTFWQWQNEAGDLLCPHLFAEFLTSGVLLAGGIATLFMVPWAMGITLFALGALIYTSLNSLGWAFARKERLPYSIPMIFGLLGSVISIILLLG